MDCHVVGFDCSGLAMYAWGAYLSLPHLASAQRATAGLFRPSLSQLLPGDLVFFSAYLPGGTGHVAIYTGKGMVVEAPDSGSVVHRAALADLIAHDGVYRGAVRPLTGATPTLSTPRTAPVAGGKLTLRGTHLAAVDTVRIGGMAIHTFARHTDSVLVVRAPAHRPGAVPVTVSTPWRATSRPASLAYAKPRPAPRAKPKKTAPRGSRPVKPVEPVKSVPKPAKPTPEPVKPVAPVTSAPSPGVGTPSVHAAPPTAPATPATPVNPAVVRSSPATPAAGAPAA